MADIFLHPACDTELLDSGIIGHWHKNNWNRDSTQTWGFEQYYEWYPLENKDGYTVWTHDGAQEHNFLGSCAKDFRPHNQLIFKAVVPSRNGTHRETYFESLEICNLIVTFGNNYPDQRGSSRWEWSGKRGVGGRQDGAWTSSEWTFIPEGGGEAETDWLLLKRV